MKNQTIGWTLAIATLAVAGGIGVTRVMHERSESKATEPPAQTSVAPDAGATGTAEPSAPAVEASAASADLSGTWKLDLARSDAPRFGDRGRDGRGPGGPGGRGFGDGRPTGEGRRDWGGGPRDSSGFRRGPGGPGGRGRFGGRMPDLIEIHQDMGAVTIADSTGEPFAEIRFDGTAPETSDEGPRVAAGTWKGNVLTVQREGRNGMKLTQTYALEDGGSTLVVASQVPAFGDRPARDFKRVYRRVSGS
jgi:hypothetical protein